MARADEMIQNTAKHARSYFEQATRADAARTQYWRTRSDSESSPRWIRDLCLAAHEDGEILPDDYRYQYIVDALDLLIEHDDADDAQCAIEADIMTADLTAWLASSIHRVGYIDAAAERDIIDTRMESFGFKVLTMAQIEEREEVFLSVVATLTRLIDEEGAL